MKNKKYNDYGIEELDNLILNEIATDPLSLDEEWLHHPNNIYKFGIMLQDAKRELSIIAHRIDLDIRNNPDNYNITKITETVIQRTTVIQEEYLEITEYIDILSSAVKAFDTKKLALQDLVKLYSSQYFAGPEEPKKLEGGKYIKNQALNKIEEKQRNEINKKRTRIRRQK